MNHQNSAHTTPKTPVVTKAPRQPTAAIKAVTKGGESVKIEGRYLLAIDDGNAYLTAGLAVLGVLWLPEYMAKAHAANGALVRLFTDWRIDPMPLYVAYAPNR